MFYVVGPGHGAPAILAALWLEGSLSRFYPDYPVDKRGLSKLIYGFSTPGGFPSHINAECPGSIHEGGELGYALSVAWGAVMDKPDLIVTCIVGDGESETGATATAWHAAKYIDPNESGAVIPIVHVNGFKISERTIYGCMDDKEMVALFSGYGYQVRFVEDLENIDADLAASMEWALTVIKKIQSDARSGRPQMKPRWPVLILRTPKVSPPQIVCLIICRDGLGLRDLPGRSLKDHFVRTRFHSQQLERTESNSKFSTNGSRPINLPISLMQMGPRRTLL